jgi:hypothetical protein
VHQLSEVSIELLFEPERVLAVAATLVDSTIDLGDEFVELAAKIVIGHGATLAGLEWARPVPEIAHRSVG